MSEAAPTPEPKRPPWKNPFVLAFVVGAVFLTVLPLLQRKFLKAPPPLKTLEPWALELPDGGAFSSAQLKGEVWIASFTLDGCEGGGCGPRQQAFGSLLKHLDTQGSTEIRVVSFVVSRPDAGALSDSPHPKWIRLVGEPDPMGAVVMGGFRDGFVHFTTADAGTSLRDFAQLPVLALVDQEGALRGFWKDDEVGRGNVINAALLLARYGPRP